MDELVLSVHELNTYVSDKLSGDPFLEEIWVRGEVTDVNMRHDTLYFVLKDEMASVGCLLFNCVEAVECSDAIVEGQTILARGEVSLYRKNGNYRIVVKEVQQVGLGELYARFQQIREKLDRLGVFDEARKRPLPRYPKKVGIVTSGQGAAIQDICNIAQRRNPQVKLVLYPVRVQGTEAPAEIARGIEYLNENSDADLLIVGRGGGSAEDLFAFNEEAVVLSVYRSRIPVVSAVGHETDFTLCDMAADLRAPTPSAAAELSIPARDDIYSGILALREGISQRLFQILYEKKSAFEQGRRSLRREVLVLRLSHAHESIASHRDIIKNAALHLYKNRMMQYNGYKSAIENLSPISAFERGYSIAMHNGKELRSTDEVSGGDEIEIILKDGTVNACVTGSKKHA
ncbi:exodeoxyribonuclease VII large subunit [Christensenella tenuis]|uniref:Exodeoxyribonuclease 7 large subunit n=1 Tax=Christensenella tenuis TaxID=2763033 RepID=A0ABR7EBJ3_9FIRM|nr:exodeoxyribonuclease VII large subunit [Christensenella tenuis]MBC5647144.1 exodeoxyribonuclease VII large subunit [Christensenella tenuis]